MLKEYSSALFTGVKSQISIVFNNGEYQYEVINSVDRNTKTQEPKHGVLIRRKSTYLDYKACIPDTMKGSLLDLTE